MDRKISHEQVSAALARYRADGGKIDRLKTGPSRMGRAKPTAKVRASSQNKTVKSGRPPRLIKSN